MRTTKHALAIAGAGVLAAGFTGCKLDHDVSVKEPIHIKLDINVTLKKEVENDLTDLFGDEDNATKD